ncbi:MAG: hypothetical protein ACLR4A_00605 [Christensenellales bacterium]
MALRVLGGVTLTDAAACAAIPFGVNTENLRTVTALSTAEMRVQADCPQVVTEIDNRYLASDVKLWLGDLLTTRRRSIFWKTPPNRARRPGRSSFANWTGRTTTTTEPPCLCRESAYTTEAAHPMRTLCRSSAVCARPAGARGTGRRPITH